jgi:hypothetical protein
MATEIEYRALDAAYRAGTAQMALVIAQAMMAEWVTVDVNNLAGTSQSWLDRAIAAVVAGHRASAGLANLYTERIRGLSLPGEPWRPPATVTPNLEQIRKSLIYTGLASTAREIWRLEATARGDIDLDGFIDIEEAREIARQDQLEAQQQMEARKRQLMQNAITRATGAAVRHVIEGGRDQIDENIARDPRALGYYRTTKPGCCSFCAMLASRGPVYKKDSFDQSNARFEGPGNHKVHDHCGCGQRPIYSTEDPLPDQTAEFSDLWAQTSKGARGNRDALNRFRREYELRLRQRQD